MQLEAGKKYTDRRGRVYGPLSKDSQFYAEQFGCQLWYDDGRITPGRQFDMDLVAEYVEPVKAVEPAPVERPDDWVIQDRVPARNGIDHGCFSPGVTEKPSHPWLFRNDVIASSRKHGDIITWGDTLNVYCRRKDLPPVPPKTRTVVLKEWLCWENAEPETVTLAWCSTSPADETEQFSAWDNAVETGNTRTVEIPVT